MRIGFSTGAMAIVAAILAAGSLTAAPQKKQGAPARKAPAAQDWTKVVTATAEGGFRMGNPRRR
jgi:hypothetical protein